MFYLGFGDIQPGEGIGILKLGMTFEQIQNIISEYAIEDLDEARLVKAGDVQVWLRKKINQVYQIMVFGDFKGKYRNVIGIGSTLGDVRKHLKTGWHDELDCTVLDNAPGMCFQPADFIEDEWDEENESYETYELREPIGYISVYRDLPQQNGYYELVGDDMVFRPE